MTTLLLGLVSLVAGTVGAITGQGGGILLVPFLTLVMGVPIKSAIAASTVSVIATSSGSASAYVRDRLTNLKAGMFLEVFTMLGALSGARVTLSTEARPLYLAFGLALLGSFVILWIQAPASVRAPVRPDRLSRFFELSGVYYDPDSGRAVPYTAARAGWGSLLMFGAGFVAGMLGIGAGALKVLIYDLVMKLPPKVSTTTSNFVIGVTALAGASAYLAAGLVRPGVAVPVILGVTIGSRFGAKLLVHLSDAAVRRLFMAVLCLLGIEMALRGLGML